MLQHKYDTDPLQNDFAVPAVNLNGRNRQYPGCGTALEQMARKMRPPLVLLSAGFDAHLQDPIGSLGLETEAFEAQRQKVDLVIERLRLQYRAAAQLGRLTAMMAGDDLQPVVANP